jgi:hypothetical protein
METPASPADELPALYREILDRLAPLERGPFRNEALRIRARASRVYAQSWSEHGRKALHNLLRRIDRLSVSQDRQSTRSEPVLIRRLRPQRRPITAR